MTQIVTATPGLLPLPDWAKDDLSDLKGHQKEDLIAGDEGTEITSVYDRARTDVIERQHSAGLDRIVEGQLRWDDMLAHPLAVHDAVETKGIVRYYDNNNFYREPVVTGELAADGDVAAELDAATEHVDDGMQAVLPGPYSLADLATDEYYGDEPAFLDAIASFLAAEARSFPPVETLVLLEPSLVESPPDTSAAERASEAIETVAVSVDADVVVQPYWGPLRDDVHAAILEADIDALGYDLVSAPEACVAAVQEYGTTADVALGVVDGQNTLVESPTTIRERIDSFITQTPDQDYETIYATTNTELFYLPVNKFEAKLDALGDVGRTEVPV